MKLNERGFEVPVSAPPGTGWRPLDEAVAVRDRVQREHDEHRETIKGLEERLAQAKRQAQELEADAVVTGKKPPRNADRDVAEIEAKLGQARERLEVLKLARERAIEGLIEVVERNRERWLAESRALEQGARGEPRALQVDPNVWLRRLLGREPFPGHHWMRRGHG